MTTVPMSMRVLLLSLTVLASFAAHAQDAGTPDAGVDAGAPPLPPPPETGPPATDVCEGDLTVLGRCDGDVLVFCQAGAPAELDCAAQGQVCEAAGAATGFTCADPPVVEPSCAQSSASGSALFALLALALLRRRR